MAKWSWPVLIHRPSVLFLLISARASFCYSTAVSRILSFCKKSTLAATPFVPSYTLVLNSRDQSIIDTESQICYHFITNEDGSVTPDIHGLGGKTWKCSCIVSGWCVVGWRGLALYSCTGAGHSSQAAQAQGQGSLQGFRAPRAKALAAVAHGHSACPPLVLVHFSSLVTCAREFSAG